MIRINVEVSFAVRQKASTLRSAKAVLTFGCLW